MITIDYLLMLVLINPCDTNSRAARGDIQCRGGKYRQRARQNGKAHPAITNVIEFLIQMGQGKGQVFLQQIREKAGFR